MSSSTALLPKKKDDHPIFLRICHSPWSCIDQKALTCIRGTIFAYLLATFFLIAHYESEITKQKWFAFFEFANVVFILQLLYQGIAFMWTFMHLHYPFYVNQTPSNTTRFQKLLSPPKQRAATNNRTWFSIFYTAAITFPLLVTFIFWAYLFPTGKADLPEGQELVKDEFFTFIILAKYAINSFIALVEVFFLSSIKRQEPLFPHILGLAFLTWLSIGWAFIGFIITNRFSYFFLDHLQVGWERVIWAFVGLTVFEQLSFSLIYTITHFREFLTKSNEAKKGYAQLPQ